MVCVCVPVNAAPGKKCLRDEKVLNMTCTTFILARMSSSYSKTLSDTTNFGVSSKGNNELSVKDVQHKLTGTRIHINIYSVNKKKKRHGQDFIKLPRLTQGP